jgi:four helix bundle protein
MPSTPIGTMFARQIARAGTSVGANVEEAQDSPSRKDFARRLNIARCEAREALFGLRLVGASGLIPEKRLGDIIREANELVSILTATVKRSRANAKEKA